MRQRMMPLRSSMERLKSWCGYHYAVLSPRVVVAKILSLVWQHLFVPFSITPNVDYYSCLFGRLVMAHYIITHSDKTCIQEPPLHPIGLGKLFTITGFCTPDAIRLQRPILAIALLVYVWNRFPILSSSYVLLYLTLVYQAVNGNGTIFHGYQIVALTLLMQWAGHIFLYVRNRVLKLKPRDELPGHYGNVTEDAFVFRLSAMGVCGVYVTSAISKHLMSQGTWFEHAEYFVTNFISVNEREYYNLGIRNSDFVSVILPQILMRYPILARWFFGSAFYLELLAPLFLYNRFTMMVGGVVTWVMHEVIAMTMRLNFKSHQRMLMAYLIDPVYWFQVCYAIYQIFMHYYNQYYATINNNNNSTHSHSKDGKTVVSIPVTMLSTPDTTTPHKEKEKDEDKVESPITSSNGGIRLKKASSRHQSLLRRVLAFIWRFPFKSMILLIIVCLYIKEVFPFSNFPMYGKPPKRGDYFYISDKNGEPLFTEVNFQMSGAQMKRSFFTSCKKYLNTNQPDLFRWNATAIEHCGNQSLAFFDKIARNYRRNYLEWHKPWSLNWVYLELQKNMTVTKQTTIIARLDRNETYLAENPDLLALKQARDAEKAKRERLKRKRRQKALLRAMAAGNSTTTSSKSGSSSKKKTTTLSKGSKGSNSKNSTVPITKAGAKAPVGPPKQ